MSFFSKLGENIILPQDVLIQSKETAAVAGAINATIGIATINKKATIQNIYLILLHLDYQKCENYGKKKS